MCVLEQLGAVGKYQYKFEPPYVLGAEASGQIIEVGAKVKGYKVGDAVCVGMAQGVFASEVREQRTQRFIS
jgi:NADPH:quinone reductase-like Zn-dependent oxidoreductase